MTEEITSRTSPDLRVLGEVLELPWNGQEGSLAGFILGELNRRGWFMVPADQVVDSANPSFTPMELGQIYMLARTDIEDTSEDVSEAIYNEDKLDSLIRALKMLRLSHSVARKTRQFAGTRPELEP